jgi:hypothetical protein
MDDSRQKSGVSQKKLEANRANARRSTGPTTAEGKRKSSLNCYKHGIFANNLFPNAEQLARDGGDYNSLAKGFWGHFAPVGFMEQLLVERIATAALRLARLLAFEQRPLSWGAPFESRSMDRIVRYETALNRQLNGAIEQLELLQEKRMAEMNDSDAALPDPDNASRETHEMTAEPFENAAHEGPEMAAAPAIVPEAIPILGREGDEADDMDDPSPTREDFTHGRVLSDVLPPEDYETKPPHGSQSTDSDDQDEIAAEHAW